MENEHSNDNTNTWQSLAAVTAKVLEPTEKQKEQRERDTSRSSKDKADTADKREYVDARLREIAAWERRINGGRKV